MDNKYTDWEQWIFDFIRKQKEITGYKTRINIAAFADRPCACTSEDFELGARYIDHNWFFDHKQQAIMIPCEASVSFCMYYIKVSYTAYHPLGVIKGSKTVRVSYHLANFDSLPDASIQAVNVGYTNFPKSISREFTIQDDSDPMRDYFEHARIVIRPHTPEAKEWQKMLCSHICKLVLEKRQKTADRREKKLLTK